MIYLAGVKFCVYIHIYLSIYLSIYLFFDLHDLSLYLDY